MFNRTFISSQIEKHSVQRTLQEIPGQNVLVPQRCNRIREAVRAACFVTSLSFEKLYCLVLFLEELLSDSWRVHLQIPGPKASIVAMHQSVTIPQPSAITKQSRKCGGGGGDGARCSVAQPVLSCYTVLLQTCSELLSSGLVTLIYCDKTAGKSFFSPCIPVRCSPLCTPLDYMLNQDGLSVPVCSSLNQAKLP